ncbi:MAG: cytochrome c [Flavobacterium sp.]|uniref:c-type cytochrome n=1 Tax=Flavobacterium sp. TaxID=239 RepID=UPI0022BFAEB3|nr:cytochrome c [Flavobacterium sp.]MCZ8196519.1 cytochrome c [Flavobacterium sp.]
MKTRISIISLIALLIFACSPKTSPTTSTSQTAKIVLTPDLIAAKMSYENNCAKCHELFKPKDYTAEQWKPILLSMQKKANITDQEREKIYAYLTMN